MKPIQKRGVSNPKARLKQLETQQLEIEAKQMEDKLIVLKTIMQTQKEAKEKQQQVQPNGARWKAAAQTKNIKNYAQTLLDQKRKTEAEKAALTKKPLRFNNTQINMKPQTSTQRITQSSQSSRIQTHLFKGPSSGRKSIGKLDPIQDISKQSNFSNEFLNTTNPFEKIQQMRETTTNKLKIIQARKSFQQDDVDISNGSINQKKVLIPKNKLKEKNIQQLSKKVFETQTESFHLKNCCWQCYKLSEGSLDFQQHFNKLFCSFECFTLFKEQNVIECSQCLKEFCRGEGYFACNQWICSTKCQNIVTIEQAGLINQIEDRSVQSEESDYQNEFMNEELPINAEQQLEQFNEFLTQSMLNNEPKKLEDLEVKYKMM